MCSWCLELILMDPLIMNKMYSYTLYTCIAILHIVNVYVLLTCLENILEPACNYHVLFGKHHDFAST